MKLIAYLNSISRNTKIKIDGKTYDIRSKELESEYNKEYELITITEKVAEFRKGEKK